VSAPVDFDRVNRAALAALPVLLRRWLPDGRQIAGEWVVRNSRRADRSPGCAAGGGPISLPTTRAAT